MGILTVETAIIIVCTSICTSVGGAFTEIWIKPYLLKVKAKHEALNKRLKL